MNENVTSHFETILPIFEHRLCIRIRNPINTRTTTANICGEGQNEIEVKLKSVFNIQLESYKSAVLTKDVEKFQAIYSDQIMVFDLWGKWCHRGRQEWAQSAQDWFRSLGSDSIVVEFTDLNESAFERQGFLSGLVHYTARSSSGVQLRTMTNRITWILEKVDESWRVVHEHTSVPLDFESGKGIFKV